MVRNGVTRRGAGSPRDAIVSLNGGSEDTDLHFRAPDKYRAWRFDLG
jgi:hypothetical protein